MTFSVYLHRPIADVLKCYGDLDSVTNRILALGDEGVIEIMDKPAIPPREGAIRFNINVTNESYLSLLNSFAPNSSHISLRRLLYWFVENEMYNELGWKVVNPYKDAKREAWLKKICKIKSDLSKLVLSLPAEHKYIANDAVQKLTTLEEIL